MYIIYECVRRGNPSGGRNEIAYGGQRANISVRRLLRPYQRARRFAGLSGGNPFTTR